MRSWLRHKVIHLGLYRTYRVAELARRLRQRSGRPVLRLAKALRAAALRLHYRVQLRLPLRADRAVFAAYGGRGHGCNPGALEEAFRTFAPHIRTAWIARPEHHHTIPTATLRLRPGTAAYWTALARSKYLVNNTDFDRRLVKRPGQVLVQTQHGTPLKHMGLDLQERPAAAGDLDFDEMLGGVDQWDHLLSANRHTTLTWERVYPGGYTVLPYGYPRNDVFQRATSQDVRRLRESLGIPEGTVAILYAPTHRDYRRTQRTTLDLDRLLRRLGPASSYWRAPTTATAARSSPRDRPGHRRQRPPERRVPVSGLGRPGHRLLVPDVRLRQPGPPDRDPRRRPGGVRGGPRHLLRPAVLRAGRGRAQRRRTDRHLRHRPLVRVPLHPAALGVPSASARTTTAAPPSGSYAMSSWAKPSCHR